MENMYWGAHLFIGYNAWCEEGAFVPTTYTSPHGRASMKLRFDRHEWNKIVNKCVQAGINFVVIDIHEGLQYETHPELSAEGAFTKDELKAELARLRSLGITPVPKLNFSLTHNAWLRNYRRLATSDTYNKVCAELINEVCDVFGDIPFFHIGMDEENLYTSGVQQYAVYRQFDLWWQDLYFLLDVLYKRGVRAAVWSDYMYEHQEEYIEKMPKDVLQFPWYYLDYWGNCKGDFRGLTDEKQQYGVSDILLCEDRLRSFELLDKHGFDLIASPSNWSHKNNTWNMTKFCRERLTNGHLKGFMQTVWKPTLGENRDFYYEALDLFAEAKAAYDR